MIVVQINATYGTGSIGRISFELSRSLSERGVENHTFYGVESIFSNAKRIGCKWDHKLHALLSRVTGLQGYFSCFSTWLLIGRLKKIKPDIVHLHNLHSNYINLPLLFRYLAKNNIVTVITLHDLWFLTGKCAHPIQGRCEKFSSGCGLCPQRKDRLNPTFFFDTSSKCWKDKKKWLTRIPRLAVIGVSKWASNQARVSYLQNREIQTIYNWIDHSFFCPRKTDLKKRLNIDNKFVILFVSASFSIKKGYNIIKRLAAEKREDEVIFAIGKEDLPLPSNIIHINHTDNAIELSECYSLADVCVNCTQCETFGMVTAEALSCGTPVIVYNNTASPELVGDCCGYVVEESDGIVAIKNKLAEIKKNGKAFYSNHCRDFAKEHFDKEKKISKYVELYKHLLVQKGKNTKE